IGVPELVDHDGHIDSSHSLPWHSRDVRAHLRAYGEITIASDVRAAALAEAQLGAGQAEPTFLYLTGGAGVSCTLVIDGYPYVGANGHAIAFANGTTCAATSIKGEVKFECLEDRVSGSGLVRRARALGVNSPDAHGLCRSALLGPGLARDV